MYRILNKNISLLGDGQVKWLVYTVGVGLIPVASRLLMWGISENRRVDMFNAADFMAFGLILQISNINALEHHNDSSQSWKTIQNGLSIAFIIGYGLLSGAHILGQSNPGIIDLQVIKYLASLFAGASLLLSFSIFHRLSKLSNGS